jgi:hypothetical protein
MTKAQKQEQSEAIETLRELLPPGSTVHTILEHVSRSGMQRRIRPVVLTTDADGQPRVRNIGYLLGKATERRTIDHSCVCDGCGMDMGFDLVYSLSYALWGDGYTCSDKRCPSPDHNSNQGNAPRSPKTRHKDGYALRQEWM